ncbi:MAG: FdhF/YdeP family oxidoreductase [Bacteroidota bacterium]
MPKLPPRPEDSHQLEQDQRSILPEKAGGLPAVQSSLQHIQEEMGLLHGFSALLKMNQMTGFDCPGCAWPDPDDKRSLLAEYCENGAKALAEEATHKRVDPDFFARFSVKELQQGTDYWLGKQGRITHPMVLHPGESHYQPIEWSEAFHLITNELNALASADEAIFYTSGRTSNEAAFLYQLMVRMFGTNNLPDCSNMCHESSGQGLSQTLGIGKGSVTLEDLHQAEVIMVVGQNPGTNHPRMLTALQQCKANGGKIITVNPLPEVGLMRFAHPQKASQLLGDSTQLTDIFLQVRVNGDIALTKALMQLLIQADALEPGSVINHEFIANKTTGWEALREDVMQHDFDQLVEKSGVGENEIRAAAELLIRHERIIICWAMGLTQHENGVENIREMVNLLLMKGSIGKRGAGTCPVRGHSNVQGDRTMGIWEKPPQAFLDRLEKRFAFSPPQKHGYDTAEAIEAMHDGRAKLFFAMGGNFLSASPDTDFTAIALQNCRLTVQVSTKLNRSHLVHGQTALILPCIARSEEDLQASGQQFVSIENSMGVVQASKGSLAVASAHLRSEVSIICGLAEKLLPEQPGINWPELAGNYDVIRNLIEDCIPGFGQYNLRVRQPGGFYLPNGAREGQFHTPDQKAHFTINNLPTASLQDDQLILTTVRSHDQFNTTIYGLDDRYRGIKNGRRVIFMHEDDITDRGLFDGQLVDIHSHFEGEKRTAKSFRVIKFDIARHCCAAYFPEANVLVPIRSRAKGSNTPASKFIVITVNPS